MTDHDHLPASASVILKSWRAKWYSGEMQPVEAYFATEKEFGLPPGRVQEILQLDQEFRKLY